MNIVQPRGPRVGNSGKGIKTFSLVIVSQPWVTPRWRDRYGFQLFCLQAEIAR